MLLTEYSLAQDFYSEAPRYSDGSSRVDEEHTFKDSWKVLEKLYAEGKCKAIGVSNFSIKT